MVVKLDNEQVEFRSEPDVEDANGLQYIVYPYHPEKHGQKQLLTITFEPRHGPHDTHVYETRHGMRILHRIDPALPK